MFDNFTTTLVQLNTVHHQYDVVLYSVKQCALQWHGTLYLHMFCLILTLNAYIQTLIRLHKENPYIDLIRLNNIYYIDLISWI